MINHEAIYALYPNAINIAENPDTGELIILDIDKQPVEIDLVAVNAWVDPNQYKQLRAAEYPSYADQFDTIFHEGIDAWKAQIQAIKDKYPKV